MCKIIRISDQLSEIYVYKRICSFYSPFLAMINIIKRNLKTVHYSQTLLIICHSCTYVYKLC